MLTPCDFVFLFLLASLAQSAMVEQICDANGSCTENSTIDGYIKTTDYGEPQVERDEATKALIAQVDKYMHERVFLEKQYENIRYRCQNKHELCSYWAAIGECEANTKYMLVRAETIYILFIPPDYH